MSDESEEDRIANRVWLVTIVALVGVLAYGLGWAGWLHGSDTPEPVASADWKPAAEPAGEPSAQAVAEPPSSSTPAAVVCPFADVAVPDDGECPDDRPPPPELVADLAEREQQRHQRAVEAALRAAELDVLRVEALGLADAGRLPDALELIDARLATEDELCEPMEGGGCRILGTVEEWFVARGRFDAIREVRCELLVDAGIVVPAEGPRWEGTDHVNPWWVESQCRRWELLTVEGLSHPKVQNDVRAILEDVVATHEEQWPWLRTAWQASGVVFYDSQLPEMCPSSACTLSHGGTGLGPPPQMLFTLDLVNMGHHDEALVHELAHVWSSTAGPPAQEALDVFAGHYAGCHSGDLSSERFVSELLADAVVVMTLGLDGRGYGYYGLDFAGCLVEGPPPEALNAVLRARLAGLVSSSGV